MEKKIIPLIESTDSKYTYGFLLVKADMPIKDIQAAIDDIKFDPAFQEERGDWCIEDVIERLNFECEYYPFSIYNRVGI